MVSALEQLNCPSRADFVSLAERLTNLELLLDDMAAKLSQLCQLATAPKAASEPSVSAPKAEAEFQPPAPKAEAEPSLFTSKAQSEAKPATFRKTGKTGKKRI